MTGSSWARLNMRVVRAPMDVVIVHGAIIIVSAVNPVDIDALQVVISCFLCLHTIATEVE